MTSTEVRPSLSEQIYTEVRNEIATLKLQPGTLLFENALASRYDTSRTPVRKALTRLEQDGLLQVLPQRGGTDRPAVPAAHHRGPGDPRDPGTYRDR